MSWRFLCKIEKIYYIWWAAAEKPPLYMVRCLEEKEKVEGKSREKEQKMTGMVKYTVAFMVLLC